MNPEKKEEKAEPIAIDEEIDPLPFYQQLLVLEQCAKQADEHIDEAAVRSFQEQAKMKKRTEMKKEHVRGQ